MPADGVSVMSPLYFALVAPAFAQDPSPAAPPAAESPPPPTPEPALPVASGDLFIQSPSVARIWMDGVDSGKDAPGVLSGVAAGPHAIRLISGCTFAEGTVEVASGVVSRLELAPKLVDVAMSATSEPPGARLAVDGVVVGTTPIAAGTLPCGGHALRWTLEGHLPVEQRVEAVAGTPLVLAQALTVAQFGTVVFVPTPISGRLSMDGAGLADGPATVPQVLSGEHAFRVDADGYRSWSATLTVPPEGSLRIDPTLPEREIGAPRIAGLSLLGVGVVSSGAALFTYANAKDAYGDYLQMRDFDRAEAFYDDEVRPDRAASAVWSVAAALSLGGGGVLLATSF